jgi:hypothetical protein
MSLFRNQLRTAYAQIDACEALALSIEDADSDALHLGWLKEALAEARLSLNKIDVKIVEAFRRQGKPTDDVLDEHVGEAADVFQDRVSGVLACIDKLNDHFGEKRNAPAVLTLEKIRGPARKTVRTLYFMTRPKLSWLLSWRGLLLIIASGLIATCFLYVSHYAIHTQSGLSPAQSVKSRASRDVERIQEEAHKPDESLMDRTLKTITTIVDLLPKIPKAILAVTAIIAAFQRVLPALVWPSKRR